MSSIYKDVLMNSELTVVTFNQYLALDYQAFPLFSVEVKYPNITALVNTCCCTLSTSNHLTWSNSKTDSLSLPIGCRARHQLDGDRVGSLEISFYTHREFHGTYRN